MVGIEMSAAFSMPLQGAGITTRTAPSLSKAPRTSMVLGAKMMAGDGDCACTIIGAGRIGSALADMGKASGFEDVIVRRGEPIPEDGSGPIYVTVRNDDLKGVIDACPASRRDDLTFYGQNGYIEDFLAKEKLDKSSSQVLVYMAVAKLGEKPTDGITDLNPEGLTSATGKWAGQVAARLKSAGLTCQIKDTAPFQLAMFEKHMWICAFMLLGVHHGGVTVGEVESKHTDDLVQMVTEMQQAIQDKEGVKFEAKCPERLLAYARTVAHFPTALKEFDWRNKYFLDITRDREASGKPDLTPMHTKLLLKARDDGHVKFD